MSQRADELAEIIRGRRTINDFRPDAPPPDDVLAAIEMARWAPNHKLTEPWRFHLIGPQTATAIVDLNSRIVTASKGIQAAEAKRLRWSAIPGWLAVTCVRSSNDLRAREDYAACCCAMQNLLLALWSRGIGSKWSTGEITRTSEFASLLRIDTVEREVVGLIWYGYPATVPRMHRKDVDSILDRLP